MPVLLAKTLPDQGIGHDIWQPTRLSSPVAQTDHPACQHFTFFLIQVGSRNPHGGTPLGFPQASSPVADLRYQIGVLCSVCCSDSSWRDFSIKVRIYDLLRPTCTLLEPGTGRSRLKCRVDQSRKWSFTASQIQVIVDPMSSVVRTH